MRKSVLTLAFSILFINASMAIENESAMPLTSTMDKNMRMLVSTNIAYLGKELQLRATDLYIMGKVY
ncbi:MAG TPA: hypothetical protein VMW10_06785 [Alphaproteobacteria bacterium]|nr:hypothetical protein [Alphaproteobacteria bacterium]